MNNNIFLFIGVIIPLLTSSSKQTMEQEMILRSKQEIIATEKEFETFLKTAGIADAFAKFADDKGVINRNDSIIMGKSGIREFYEDRKNGKFELLWSPQFVDVSKSGDLGYTYGPFTYTVTDSSGKATVYKGIFHTIWKKQADGTWKFVWD
jgi:ketosteroid isomerase-like protein